MSGFYNCNKVIININNFPFSRNNNFRIRLGIWSLSATSYPYFDAYPVFTQLHVNFNRNTLQNDIAIIQLDRPIPFANYANINTACLPTSIPTAGTRLVLDLLKKFVHFIRLTLFKIFNMLHQ